MLWDDVSRLLNLSFEAIQKLTQDAQFRLSKPSTPSEKPISRPTVKPGAKVTRRQKFPLDWEFFRAALGAPEKFFKFPKSDWVGFIKDPELESLLVTVWDTQDVSQMGKVLESLASTHSCPEVLAAVTESLMNEVSQAKVDPQLFPEVAKRISERKQKAQIQGLANQVRLSQRLGDSEEQLKLLEQLKNIRLGTPSTPPKA
jgi:hypothetical protein